VVLDTASEEIGYVNGYDLGATILFAEYSISFVAYAAPHLAVQLALYKGLV